MRRPATAAASLLALLAPGGSNLGAADEDPVGGRVLAGGLTFGDDAHVLLLHAHRPSGQGRGGGHLTRALADAGDFHAVVEYSEMIASMSGVFVDLRAVPDHPSLDPGTETGYPAGNALAAQARAAGHNGIIYPSVRHPGGTCIAALWPNVVQSVVQGAMYRLSWSGTPEYSCEAL